MTRVDLSTAQPATYKALLELHRTASKAAHDAELPDDIYAQIATSLSAEQIAAAHWLAIVINAFNRIAIASHADVSPA